MGIPELIFFLLGLIGKAIPPLKKRLDQRNDGFAVWKSEITYWAGLPRSVKEQFFGRDDELKKISDSLKNRNAVVLSGGPGIGKSKLAAEFAGKSKRNGFWTPGGATPEQMLLSLAPHLGIERGDWTDGEILVQTRRRLQALPAKTLWVIDNLSDLDLLNSLLNEIGKISILVTSQDGRTVVPEGVGYIPIEVLGPEAATRLLCRSGNYDYKLPVFLEIVEEVGRLPRAVEALAGQLELPGETPVRLLEELHSKPNPLEFERFQKQTAGLQIPRSDSLFNALRGPIDALLPEIREALAPLGYTADSPIPMALAEALTGLSGGALINFFDECTGKSVLSVVGEQVTIHSLTAAGIAATNSDGSLRNAVERAGARLGNIVDSRQLATPNELLHYERLSDWASLEIDREILATLEFPNSLANAFYRAGRFEEATAIHQENLEVRQRVLGPEHPDTLASRNNLAVADQGAGRFKEAATLHQENLEVRERVLGPEHPDTLGSRNNLAEASRSSGRFEEAAGLHFENLEVRERVLGQEHPDTLSSRNNLAVAHQVAGRFKEAATLHQENLEVRERVLGQEHLDTLGSRINLAIAYSGAGRHEEAATLHQETLEVMERVLGPEHPNTLASRSNLANAYQGAGRFEEAAGLEQETLAVRQRVLGPEHPNTLGSRNNLANAYDGAGLYEEAAGLHQENLEVRQRVLGPEHPDTLASRSNLAAAYQGAGRFEETAGLQQETLEVMERVLGPEHPDTLNSRNNLAAAHHSAGRYEEAARLQQETLEVLERVLGPEHPDTLRSRNNLAATY